MAIKITKPGQKEFHAFCKWCGCEFTYEISDLKLSASSDKVSCPTCGRDYHHPSMVQDPTLQSGIGYQWPSDSTDPCAGCAWRENLLRDGLYIGDTPCNWCNKNRLNSLTCQPSIKDYTTPYVNQLDSYLSTTSTTSELSGTKHTKVYGNAEDPTQGNVMKTILECCHNCIDGLAKHSDTEPNSCSGEHKCKGNKQCKGNH